MNRLKKFQKGIAAFLAINLLIEVFAPAAVWALTAGPASPEFSSFEPVATTDMVNLFSGDFNYNLPILSIPGPDGGGYALSLSYHSGSSSEEEASWVGFGWTLNPGALNRNMRGFPDDYKDAKITRYNKAPVNASVSFTNIFGTEIRAKKDSKNTPNDSSRKSIGSLSYSNTIRYNNYQGFSKSRSFGANAYGMVGINVNNDAQGTTYSAQVNVLPLIEGFIKKFEEKLSYKVVVKKDKDKEVIIKKIGTIRSKVATDLVSQVMRAYGSTYGIYSFSQQVRTTALTPTKGKGFSWDAGITANTGLLFGFNTGVRGNLNVRGTEKVSQLKANGFMNYQSEVRSDLLADYYVEKNNPYKKQSLFLGIPFANADHFVSTGEGIMGSFRYHPYKTGHFFPNSIDNKMSNLQIGFDFLIGVSAGVSVGFGASLGLGWQKTVINKAKTTGSVDGYRFENDGSPNERGIMRFANDMAGQVIYGNDKTPYARFNSRNEVNVLYNVNNQGELDKSKISNSSYVAYHTKDEYQAAGNAQFYKNQTYNEEIEGSSLVEMAVTNENGMRYVYGQPVFNRNELSLGVNVDPSKNDPNNYINRTEVPVNVDFNSTAFKKFKVVTGEERPTPYASDFLLTQINTSDYVDVGNNGPDKEDFGGWTKFQYHKKYGFNQDHWYHWRTPYQGLYYEQNTISDINDDMGNFSTGQKEVFYLKAIETKTHIAYFVTNQSDPTRFNANPETAKYLQGRGQRTDGLDTKNKELEYLEKIVLFSKDRPGLPLSTTYFSYYDQGLVRGLPNGKNGKLTLHKVWSESEGVVSGRISPYEFVYQYKPKAQFPQEILTKYPEIFQNYLGDRLTADAQNPVYAPEALDGWGNHQLYGPQRKKYDIPWVYQGEPTGPKAGHLGWLKEPTLSENTPFDPAAWQLKQIKLPSGGEILIEYEQKDYAYVQNRNPMAMVTLAGEPQNEENGNKYGNNPAYVINTSELGISTPAERQELLEKLLAMKERKEKIYFKFLYAFQKGLVPTLFANQSGERLSYNAGEYITGYAAIENATIEGNNIKIILSGTEKGDRVQVPREALYDFYTTQRQGKNTPLDKKMESRVNGFINQDDPGKLDLGLKKLVDLSKALQEAIFLESIPKKNTIGRINPGLSYLRVPTIKAKKGGGIRVKRLMMYDKGIEAGDASLYGQEYIYEDIEKIKNASGTVTGYKVISSGVATTEPTLCREENPLVGFLAEKNQAWFDRITAGEDKEQAEGPIGESLLPGASIGHSRIVVKNIHKGESGNGFTVHEYYTAKEYPFDNQKTYLIEPPNAEQLDKYQKNYEEDLASYKSIENTYLPDNTDKDKFIIPAGLFFFEANKVQATQGYRFIINNMHGQMKRTAQFAGDYYLDPTQDIEKQLRQYPRISETYTEYYQPGQKVRMLQPDGSFIWDTPGKEMEIALESRSVQDRTFDLGIDLDIMATIPTITPIDFAISLSFSYSDRGIATHTASKIIRYPAIIKKVYSYHDGVKSYSENLAFNPDTGAPILTRTVDGYDQVNNNGNIHDGSLYSLSLPASWFYPEMGNKYKNGIYNPDHTNELNAMAGQITSYGSAGRPIGELAKTPTDPPITGSFITKIDNVVSANIQTFEKGWFDSNIINLLSPNFTIPGSALGDLNKIWRPYKSFVYRTNVRSANNTAREGILEGGVFKNGERLENFDFGSGQPTNTTASNWILGSEVTLYSPHGVALEEKDVLGVPSTALFGYGGKMPVATAMNAAYGSVVVEDYEAENEYSKYASSSASILKNIAHTGKNSLRLNNNSLTILTTQVNKFIDIKQEKGLIVRVWVKDDGNEQTSLQIKTGTASTPLKRIATIGEWSLYRADADATKLPASGSVSVSLEGAQNLVIDDLVCQPKESQVQCFVYDFTTLRLIAKMDDQHFAILYQYNGEGKLVRQLIETERGLRTLQETQYNSITQQREE